MCVKYYEVDYKLSSVIKYLKQFFSNFMLDRSDVIEDTGTIKWDITLAYLAAWVLCFLCIIKGIKSTGKVTMESFLFN